MKNQDPDSRYQRYDFNVDGQKRRTHKKALIWPWILGLIIIVLALAFGIRYTISQHTSSQTKPKTAKIAAKQAKETNTKPVASKKSSSTTSTDKQTEANQTTNKTETNNSSKADSSQNTKAPAKNSEQTTESTFAQSRTFNSVADAKNWAKTTQSQWLADGYTNYTITQNGQGFYILTFVK